MLSQLKLKTIVLILSALIVSFMLYSFLSSMRIKQQVVQLDEAWNTYQANQNEKKRLRAELIAQLGYGGLIHKYDNYILRKSEQHRIYAWIAYGKVDATLEKLLSLADSHGERSALEDIRRVVKLISNNLHYIDEQLKSGTPAKIILTNIDINFTKATRALDNLNAAFAIKAGTTVKTEKENTYVRIVAAWGLNGFIQAFKRYVILGKQEELEKASHNAEEIRRLASEYQNFDITFGEKLAIEDIIYTLDMYSSMLDVAEVNHLAGLDSETVDTLVMIDDTEAVRGFRILEAVNIEQILSSADTVDNAITNLEQQQLDHMYQYAAFLMLLLLMFNVVSQGYVIRPIERIANAFLALSRGETDVSLGHSTNKETEIGIMENTFEVFRDNEIKRQQAEEELKKLATTDPLTGLLNRNELKKRFLDMRNIVRRNGEAIAMLMLDLDNFKQVNDNLGHNAGDELLKDIAAILTNKTRDTDIVARTGGDEFVVVLYAPYSKQDVEMLGQRIISATSTMPQIKDKRWNVGVSIGLVFEQGQQCSNLKTMIEKADLALYEAKRTGKNKVIELTHEARQYG